MVEQVVGDLAEDVVGVELEADLRAVPTRIRNPTSLGHGGEGTGLLTNESARVGPSRLDELGGRPAHRWPDHDRPPAGPLVRFRIVARTEPLPDRPHRHRRSPRHRQEIRRDRLHDNTWLIPGLFGVGALLSGLRRGPVVRAAGLGRRARLPGRPRQRQDRPVHHRRRHAHVHGRRRSRPPWWRCSWPAASSRPGCCARSSATAARRSSRARSWPPSSTP